MDHAMVQAAIGAQLGNGGMPWQQQPNMTRKSSLLYLSARYDRSF